MNPVAHWQDALSGAFLYGLIAYLIRTIPPVSNVWAKWLIGGIQYVFSNPDAARRTLADPVEKESIQNV